MEDSRSLADVLVEGLRDQGMAADAAHDGLEAAAKLDVNAYDVVVLDRDLLGIHGDTLCQMITEHDDRVMVLMLTAADSPGDRVAGLGFGADDYLAKPFHFPELVLRIRSLARRQPSARGRVLRAAGIELDPLRRTVTPRRAATRPVGQGVRGPRSAPARQARLPQRRGPARTGLGRARRPVHQHGHGDRRPTAAQTRRPAGHHHHTERWATASQPRELRGFVLTWWLRGARLTRWDGPAAMARQGAEEFIPRGTCVRSESSLTVVCGRAGR